MFAGSDKGGDRAASICSIMRTARLKGVNPEACLRDTLARMAEGHSDQQDPRVDAVDDAIRSN
jgi:hypothetical protein